MKQKIQVGDRVQYSAKFLRSCGMFTGDIPFARGTVTAIEDFGGFLALATIDWQNENVPAKVNVNILNVIGQVELA